MEYQSYLKTILSQYKSLLLLDQVNTKLLVTIKVKRIWSLLIRRLQLITVLLKLQKCKSNQRVELNYIETIQGLNYRMFPNPRQNLLSPKARKESISWVKSRVSIENNLNQDYKNSQMLNQLRIFIILLSIIKRWVEATREPSKDPLRALGLNLLFIQLLI